MEDRREQQIETLWAPWRLGYVQGRDKGDPAAAAQPRHWREAADRGCFLCRAAAAEAVHDRLLGVLERTSHSVVVINRFPYANGHLLVSPLDHRAALADLTPPQLLDLQQCLVRWCAAIERAMQAQGFNIGLNAGSVAGAGVPGHLHWHVVPRWSGDVNFMPSVAGVRVLPQSLDSLWEQLSLAVSAADRDAASHTPRGQP
jgi:ATP adenylyltransferase